MMYILRLITDRYCEASEDAQHDMIAACDAAEPIFKGNPTPSEVANFLACLNQSRLSHARVTEAASCLMAALAGVDDVYEVEKAM